MATGKTHPAALCGAIIALIGALIYLISFSVYLKLFTFSSQSPAGNLVPMYFFFLLSFLAIIFLFIASRVNEEGFISKFTVFLIIVTEFFAGAAVYQSGSEVYACNYNSGTIATPAYCEAISAAFAGCFLYAIGLLAGSFSML